jgi:CRP/FNR family transcriptional regulator, cyclic AMP receptor protein
MNKNSKTESLRNVPLFEGLSRRELSALASATDEVDLPEGRTLTLEGGVGTEFVVLADGIADVERAGERVNRLGPGDFFGEIALVTGGPRTATVTTRTPARLLVLSRPAFRSLLRTSPRIKRRILASAALRLAS